MPSAPVVVDTSAVLDYLLGEPNAEQIEEVLRDPLVQLHAPELLDQELLSVARRLEHSGELTEDRAEEILRDAVDLRIELHPLRPHVERVWSLRHGLWVADAFFASLAESLSARLLTSDRKFARSVTAVRGLMVALIVA